MLLRFRLFLRSVLVLLTLLLALPVLTVLFSWLQWNAVSTDLLLEMANTVLPGYIGTSLLLCVLVSVGVVSMGTVTAAAVTLFDFPMRRSLEWALLLPLAMPAYVVAYAYTDFLQFSGPLQTTMRELFGIEGRVFPEVRNVWGAACIF
jgi:iron(III) transport system permease protein